MALVLAEVPASAEGPGRVPTARVREGGLRVEGQEIVTSHALKPPKWCRGGGALWWRLRNPSCLGPGCSRGQEPQASGRRPLSPGGQQSGGLRKHKEHKAQQRFSENLHTAPRRSGGREEWEPQQRRVPGRESPRGLGL